MPALLCAFVFYGTLTSLTSTIATHRLPPKYLREQFVESSGVEPPKEMAMLSIRVMFCLFLLSLPAFAQSDRGTITGTVSDATGAVIPGANIALTNIDTSARY